MIHLTDEEKERWPTFAKLADKHGEPKTQAIGEFIDWLLNESRHTIADYTKDDFGDPVLVETHPNIEALICEYHGVDPDQYFREREELRQDALEQQRALNAQMSEEEPETIDVPLRSRQWNDALDGGK